MTITGTGTYLDVLDAPEESDRLVTTDQRTKPLHPTEGPGDGRSWAQFFTDVKAPYREASAAADEADEEEDEPVAAVEVTRPAYEMSDDEIAALSSRTKIAQVIKRLRSHKWEVRARRSLVHVAAVLYKNDSPEGADPATAHQKGDVYRPAHDLETTVIVAVKRDAAGRVGLALDATWTSKNGFEGARTYDPLDGREIRRGYMKARERNQIEIEEGIAAPLGLGDWLKDFAPTAADKKAAEKRAAAEAEQAAAEAANGAPLMWEAA